MTRQEAQGFFDRRIDAWRARDIDALVGGYAEDDCVVQLLTFSGTNTGGFMGVPATGKRFTFPAALICTMRDGRVAHERRVYDFTGFLVEIGVLKAKPV